MRLDHSFHFHVSVNKVTPIEIVWFLFLKFSVTNTRPRQVDSSCFPAASFVFPITYWEVCSRKAWGGIRGTIPCFSLLVICVLSSGVITPVVSLIVVVRHCTPKYSERGRWWLSIDRLMMGEYCSRNVDDIRLSKTALCCYHKQEIVRQEGSPHIHANPHYYLAPVQRMGATKRG